MFILLDTDAEGLVPFYDHVNKLDDKPVLGLKAAEDYVPTGPYHIVGTFESLETEELTRWQQHYFATKGARFFTNKLDVNSSVWAGPVPEEGKIRKISVEGAFAEGRAGLFAEYGVNYIGRTKLNPRNIFVLDNKKGNALQDPAKDALLEALYASLPDDWWGSCGFVSTGNIDKLESFFEAFPDVIPLAWTTGAFSKLRYLGLEYVTVGEPKNSSEYGVQVRDAANRLSYDLSFK